MRFSSGMLLLIILAVIPAGSASATWIGVDRFDDQVNGTQADGCSLRNAVIAADRDIAVAGCPAGGPNDSISLPGGTYALDLGTAGDADPASGDLDMGGDGDLTIWPTAKGDVVTIDGGDADRIFDIHASSDSYIDLRRLNITGGKTGPDDEGGAVRVSGGNLRLFGSSLFRNSAGGDGGAVFVTGNGILRTKNSTLAHNESAVNGGAIALGGGGHAMADLLTTTIARNVADSDGDGSGDGGGVSNPQDGTLIAIENSILARNVDRSPAPSARAADCVSHSPLGFEPTYLVTTAKPSKQCPMTLVSPSYPYNSFGTDPGLTGFGLHGGVTRSFAIGYGSPAIGAGAIYAPDHCPAYDQRGVRRPYGLCDAGAFQYSRLGKGRLPGVSQASRSTAVLAGRSVLVKVRCPRKYRPVCHSQATVLEYPSVGSKAMTKPRVLTIPAGESRLVRFRIVPRFRSRIVAMAQVDHRRLYLRQQIHARRYGKSGKPGSNLEIHWYKVRVRA